MMTSAQNRRVMLATKITASAVVAVLLVFGPIFTLHAVKSGMSIVEVVLRFVGSIAFDGFVAILMPLLVVGFMIFDLLSIWFFQIGLEEENGEFEIYGGPEGTSGPKVSRERKLYVLYPVMILGCLTIAALLIARSMNGNP